jgi:hypothetical protein
MNACIRVASHGNAPSALQRIVRGIPDHEIAPGLAEAELLFSELTTFQPKPVAATADAMLDWRNQPHDDLVLAVAIAAWLSEWLRQFWVSIPMVLDPGLARVLRW